MKILYFDTETTGIDPKVNEIIQFAAVVEIDGVIVEQVNWRCQPTNYDSISPSALETTGLTVEEIKTYQSPSEMMSKIKNLFNTHIDKFNKEDKFYPAGHNVAFDLEFLQAFWKKHGDPYGTGSYQNWRTLDSRVFANFLIASGKLNVSDVKLSTLCDHYKIQINAHDALSDILATRQLIRLFIDMLSDCSLA